MPRGGGRGGHTIAGAALRNAGLVGDADVGMRDAAGPSRSRAGGAGGRRGGRNSGADPSDPVSHSTRPVSLASFSNIELIQVHRISNA